MNILENFIDFLGILEIALDGRDEFILGDDVRGGMRWRLNRFGQEGCRKDECLLKKRGIVEDAWDVIDENEVNLGRVYRQTDEFRTVAERAKRSARDS